MTAPNPVEFPLIHSWTTESNILASKPETFLLFKYTAIKSEDI